MGYGAKLLKDREKKAAGFMLPLLKGSAVFMGPVFVALTGFLFFHQPCWQFAAVFGTMIATAVVFVAAWRLGLRGEIEKGAWIASVATMLLVTLAVCTVKGLLGVLLVSFASLSVQMAIFSKRYVFITIGWTGAGFVAGTLLDYFEPYEMIEMSPVVATGLTIVAVILLLLDNMRYIINSNSINQLLHEDMEKANMAQNRVIAAVNDLHPVIKDAVEEIEEISNGFAIQAGQQATATAEVNSTVSEVMQIAGQAAESASGAQGIADDTREQLMGNHRHLSQVVRDFEEVVSMIDAASLEISNLIGSIGEIEEILQKNRGIGEHIKVLAVNASIEAAKAGESGRGFHVVATELKEMITNTEQNLAGSRKWFDEIRTASGSSTKKIKEGAEKLLRYYSSLRETATLIESSAVSFTDTAIRVGQIAHSAREQQVGMREIDATMKEIDSAAGQLDDSAGRLIEVVKKISSSQTALRKALEG